MGNSRTDKSKDFIDSGMTLITQVESDKYLKQHSQDKVSDTRNDTWEYPIPDDETWTD